MDGTSQMGLTMFYRGRPFCHLAWAAILTSVLALAACGGGDDDNQASSDGNRQSASHDVNTVRTNAFPKTDNEAARFLTQATFGPTDSDVKELFRLGFAAWIDAQMGKSAPSTHNAYLAARDTLYKQGSASASAGVNDFTHSFWQHAIASPDQLRQRVAFALSQIFVVSAADGCGANNPRGLVGYYDMLAANAFSNYRTLLEDVARHPIMGCYLSHLRNQKESPTTGRVPDENFAREVMQLFSIGLYQLNADGSKKTDARGEPLDSYSAADISGLAKVFTGFSFQCPGGTSDSCFHSGQKNGAKYVDVWNIPMVGYPQFHSHATTKSFLGTTVPAQTSADPDASLKTALDALALEHPNVGPFIGKQLIQRLVTSNPSPQYVARVSAAFEASGRNMGAMVKAILLDPEARDLAALSSQTFGKVREPILRLSAFLRAMDAQSDSKDYLIDNTDDAATALAQSPMRSASVFNFYRPGYAFPGGASSKAGLVAPELQIANESSTAAYVNYMRDVIQYGVGRSGLKWDAARRDVQLSYVHDSNSVWLALAKASDASPLIDRIDQKLMYGSMSDSLKGEIKAAVESISFRIPTSPTSTEVNNRLRAALLLTVASPEFQVQK